MELIRGLRHLQPSHHGSVATLGAFDGVHRGHQAVIAQLRERAAEFGVPAVVVVFEPLPREYFAPEQAPPRLMSFREKFLALRRLGVDRLLRIRFDAAFSHLSPEEFVRQVFVDGLGARFVVAGDDLRYGHRRQGDFALLERLGAEHGFGVAATRTCEDEAGRISSTRLRQVLERADFAAAEKLLGRPYSISGTVIYGRQMGRRLGVPTANLALRRRRAPLAGVYVTEVLGVEDRPQPAVANVGTRPTIAGDQRANLEIHLLDYEASLYGQHLEVRFLEKLRDERRFDGLEALQQAMQRDITRAREYFGLPTAN